ncbi:unnamed protein product [Chironomus riparius]|uniref:Uncharacterized protein n=1 Tax=Chironomus riparius TaxID=315576 RepID=A0A9P0NLE8_9DIPT|nr:unnamed protein product [Chironomus riparius]
MNSVIFISLVMSVFDQPFISDQDWNNFKIEYSKNYLNRHEEVLRYNNFKSNDEKIKAHNMNYLKGKTGYKMGHNEFSDLSHEEFAAIYLHPIKPEIDNNELSFNTSLKDPAELSYKKYCLPPLSQGGCGSCWAFAAAAQVEAQLKRKNSNFKQYISPQYMLDCSGGGTCKGGSTKAALDYMRDNGFVSLNDYPYRTKQQKCNSKAPKLPQKIKSTSIKSLHGNEDSLQKALINIGPVSVSILVLETFKNYKEGIYFDDSCPSTCEKTNHAVVLVGYGTDKTSFKEPVDYWIIKNSWGTKWGEGGYFRMIKGRKGMNNNCNVACYIRYAVV